MCSLLLIPAPGPRCRGCCCFSKGNFKGSLRSHTLNIAWPYEGISFQIWPGGQGSQGTAGAISSFSRSCP